MPWVLRWRGGLAANLRQESNCAAIIVRPPGKRSDIVPGISLRPYWIKWTT
jgi:hypothetical protein